MSKIVRNKKELVCIGGYGEGSDHSVLLVEIRRAMFSNDVVGFLANNGLRPAKWEVMRALGKTILEDARVLGRKVVSLEQFSPASAVHGLFRVLYLSGGEEVVGWFDSEWKRGTIFLAVPDR